MSNFWRGIITALCGVSLYQDFLGKEEYIRRVEACWTDSNVSVPLAVLVLIIVWVSWADEPKSH